MSKAVFLPSITWLDWFHGVGHSKPHECNAHTAYQTALWQGYGGNQYLACAGAGSAVCAWLQIPAVYIVDGMRVVGLDNERGKGDHVHCEGAETPYRFVNVETLLQDFWRMVEGVKK